MHDWLRLDEFGEIELDSTVSQVEPVFVFFFFFLGEIINQF